MVSSSVSSHFFFCGGNILSSFSKIYSSMYLFLTDPDLNPMEYASWKNDVIVHSSVYLMTFQNPCSMLDYFFVPHVWDGHLAPIDLLMGKEWCILRSVIGPALQVAVASPVFQSPSYPTVGYLTLHKKMVFRIQNLFHLEELPDNTSVFLYLHILD